MLTYIHPDNLHQHWDFVKGGLEYIIRKTDDLWRPEDVYHMLKSGSMGLYMHDAGKGFAVLQPTLGWRGKELYVFCGYSRTSHDIVIECMDEIKQIGRDIGARKVKIQSSREGMEKLARELGFTLDLVQWEFEL